MAYTTRHGKIVKVHKKSKVYFTPHPHYSRTPEPEPKPFSKDKGQYNGACNRSACLKYPATWYNRGSYAFYCEVCADMLNHDNRRDAYELLGQGNELCILIETQEEAKNCYVM